MGVALFVIIFLGSGVLCHLLAKHWQMNPVLWGVVGVCIGPFAFPFMLFAKPSQTVERGEDD